MPQTNNNPAIIKRYYPKLSSIVTLDDFPEALSFIKVALQDIFNHIH